MQRTALTVLAKEGDPWEVQITRLTVVKRKEMYPFALASQLTMQASFFEHAFRGKVARRAGPELTSVYFTALTRRFMTSFHLGAWA